MEQLIKENQELKNEIDNLKKELHKCLFETKRR